VINLSERDLARFGFTPDRPGGPQGLPRTHINRRTGEVTQVPDGVAPGFAHNVGRLGMEAHSGKLLMDRLASLPPELAMRMGAASQSFALSGVSYEFENWARSIIAATGDDVIASSLRVAGFLPPAAREALTTKPVGAAVLVTDQDLVLLKSGLPSSILFRIPNALARPSAILCDPASNELLYILPGDTEGFVTVLTLAIRPATAESLPNMFVTGAVTMARADLAGRQAQGLIRLVQGEI
jgi:hypothetical protein